MQCSEISEKLHLPVMKDEVLFWIRPKPEGKYIDATLGAGGHAESILKGSSPSGKLIGIDRDEEILKKTSSRLAYLGDRIIFVKAAFDEIVEIASEAGFEKADGILADLGVSSFQLDEARRGFGFMREGPLDMRMDVSKGESAASFIANAAEETIADVIYRYGEERSSRRIAKSICRSRRQKPITTTYELAKIVENALGGRRGKIHPATRTFQAIRIHVNDELGMLSRFLESAPTLLKPGGRFLVISYHSLEDRIVKNAFKELKRRGALILTKKVIKPSREEQKNNPRSRSAKLRVLEMGEVG